MATAAESQKHLYEKNNFCNPVTLAWFSIQILVNSIIFKLSLNLSLPHLRAQIACYELKGDLSPKMLKEIFHDSIANFEITRICVEKHARVTGWQNTNASNFRRPLQSLLLRYKAEILRLPNLNMLFQLVLTKFFKSELFSCLPKVNHVIKSCKEPIRLLFMVYVLISSQCVSKNKTVL